YTFHCSDGDNWSNDNDKAVALAAQLCLICNLFGYGEIMGNYGYGSTIRREYEQRVKAANFVMVTMGKKEDVWPAFKQILDNESAAGGDQ
ncbi:MAG: hypothetical protein K0Q75_2830, partial [Anaerospora sp.]|nr:hypothetical protein [Anaerospora sp.]